MPSTDETPHAATSAADYTPEEAEALSLARVLRERVGRERATVRNLREHLALRARRPLT